MDALALAASLALGGGTAMQSLEVWISTASGWPSWMIAGAELAADLLATAAPAPGDPLPPSGGTR